MALPRGERSCEMGGCGYIPWQNSIPAVGGFLWLLTKAFGGTETLRAPISPFFLEKLPQEAPFGSEWNGIKLSSGLSLSMSCGSLGVLKESQVRLAQPLTA